VTHEWREIDRRVPSENPTILSASFESRERPQRRALPLGKITPGLTLASEESALECHPLTLSKLEFLSASLIFTRKKSMELRLTPEQSDAFQFGGILLYKMGIWMFFIIPCIAL
jgi:hypothetical protein